MNYRQGLDILGASDRTEPCWPWPTRGAFDARFAEAAKGAGFRLAGVEEGGRGATFSVYLPPAAATERERMAS